ncbi:hypothetical protein IT570_03440 [Candidatus Sumerlaeota bacterium]|nr:hypothetical protein [Candidatus Sumerlaeota bacterium]
MMTEEAIANLVKHVASRIGAHGPIRYSVTCALNPGVPKRAFAEIETAERRAAIIARLRSARSQGVTLAAIEEASGVSLTCLSHVSRFVTRRPAWQIVLRIESGLNKLGVSA